MSPHRLKKALTSNAWLAILDLEVVPELVRAKNARGLVDFTEAFTFCPTFDEIMIHNLAVSPMTYPIFVVEVAQVLCRGRNILLSSFFEIPVGICIYMIDAYALRKAK